MIHTLANGPPAPPTLPAVRVHGRPRAAIARCGNHKRACLTALAFLLLSLLALAAPKPASSHLPDEEQKLLAHLASAPSKVPLLFELADLTHDLGAEGDKQAVVRSEDYLRQLLEIDATNAPALALLGSVHTMKGRDAFWPHTQLRLVREGIAILDRAVALAPDDIRTRTIRAINNAHMPDFLGRTDIVRADLAWLWERIPTHPDRFSPGARQKIALFHGRQLARQRRFEEARQVWQTGLVWDPSSPVAKDLSTELADHR